MDPPTELQQVLLSAWRTAFAANMLPIQVLYLSLATSSLSIVVAIAHSVVRCCVNFLVVMMKTGARRTNSWQNSSTIICIDGFALSASFLFSVCVCGVNCVPWFN